MTNLQDSIIIKKKGSSQNLSTDTSRSNNALNGSQRQSYNSPMVSMSSKSSTMDMDSTSSTGSLVYLSSYKGNPKLFWTLTRYFASDLGKLDPHLYQTQDKDTFKLNIALKYSILEDVISIIIFKCTLKVTYHSILKTNEQMTFSDQKIKFSVLKDITNPQRWRTWV